jgi:medium-chain acyl-[acyl-carrier-protein] hydrolase
MDASDRWIVRPRTNARARLRLLCFPYASGGASAFLRWPEHLPADIEVAPVQLPGREERLGEEPYRDLRSLTAKLVEVLAPYLDRPFAVFGHSAGALVAFELTRALRRSGSPLPVHLFVSGRVGPTRPHRLAALSGMTDPESIEQLRRYGGTPEEVLRDRDFMELILPVFRADLALCETYVYVREEPLACPVSAFGGTLDDHVAREDLASWRDETRGAFRLRMFPGGHFFIRDVRPRLLQAISEDLGALEGPRRRACR